jgi:hypothetical protein
MAYLSKTLPVRLPLIFMITSSAIPALRKFREAVLPRYWKSNPGAPAAVCALHHEPRKPMAPFPLGPQ